MEHVGTVVLVEWLCWLHRVRCLHHHHDNYDDHDNNYHDNNDHDHDHDYHNDHDHLVAEPLLPDALP